MKEKYDFNVGLRKENFWTSINKTTGYENEFWIGEMQMITSMENAIFLDSYSATKNLETNGLKVTFQENLLLLNFDFDRFRNWLGEDSSSEKMFEAFDVALETFGIAIKDWKKVFEKEVTYNQKVLLSSKNQRHLFDILENMRDKEDPRSKEEHENCYRFFDRYSFLEFKADTSGPVIHVSAKLLDYEFHQFAVGFCPFSSLNMDHAFEILDLKVGHFFRSIETFGPESEWYKAFEIAFCSNSQVVDQKAIETIESIERLNPAMRNLVLDENYKDLARRTLRSITKKSGRWLNDSEVLNFSFQMHLRFFKRHERIVRNLGKAFKILKLTTKKKTDEVIS